MTDLSERLAQIRAGNSQLGRRPSTLSLGSCGSSRSSLSPVSSGRSVSSPMSISSSSSAASTASRSSSTASMHEARRVTTRRTQSSDTRRSETITQRRITEKKVTASTPRPPTGRKTATTTPLRQPPGPRSTATARTSSLSQSATRATASSTARKTGVQSSVTGTRNLNRNQTTTARSTVQTGRSSSLTGSTLRSRGSHVDTSADHTSARSSSLTGSTLRSARGGHVDTSADHTTTTRTRGSNAESRSVSSQRTYSSNSVNSGSRDQVDNRSRTESRPTGKYSYRSYSTSQISTDLSKLDDLELPFGRVTKPDEMMKQNRFSYRSFSSNQIMSDLNKLNEEDQYESRRSSINNLNEAAPAPNQFSYRSYSSNQIADNMVSERAKSTASAHNTSNYNSNTNTTNKYSNSGTSESYNSKSGSGNQFSYRSSSTSQLLSDLSRQLEAELELERQQSSADQQQKSAVVPNQFSYRSYSTSQLQSDLNSANKIHSEMTSKHHSKDQSFTEKIERESRDHKSSLFDFESDFENTNLQLFSNILGSISNSKQSRYTSNSSTNLEAISEDSSRLTASKLLSRAKATDRHVHFSSSLLSLGQLTSSQQSLNSQLSTTSDVNPRQPYKPMRRPLFDNMNDNENIEEYEYDEDTKNNNRINLMKSNSHNNLINSNNNSVTGSSSSLASMSRQSSLTRTTREQRTSGGQERRTTSARPARRTSTERLQQVRKSSEKMSDCCEMTSSQLVSSTNRKISNASSTSSRRGSVQSTTSNHSKTSVTSKTSVNSNISNRHSKTSTDNIHSSNNNLSHCNSNLSMMSNSNLAMMSNAGVMSSNQSLTSQLSSQEIKQRLGNRATKTVTRGGERPCFVCKRDIGEDGVFALGNLFHKQCLRCGCCGSKIDSKFFTRNGKPCCPKCAKLSKAKCRVCELEIQGDHVESGDSMYHPHCMKCYKCGTLATQNFFTHQGQPVCEEHSLELVPNCMRCGNKVVGSGFSRGEEIICNECMEAEGADICSKCSKEIKGETLALGSMKLHKACLFCVLCKENMVGKPVSVDKQNNIYCAKDYDRKFAPQCYGCKKPIVPRPGETKASRLRALDKDFHIGCFKCQDCGVKLQGGGNPGKPCYPYLHLFLCRNCKEKRECESE